MMTIKILGIGDAKTLALKSNLEAALDQYPVDGKVLEVTEVNRIAQSGVTETPALMFDNMVISEGRVPSVEELTTLLRNRLLYKSKLYRLSRILVPVDFSPASANAFHYAWQLAERYGASIDVVHAIEYIFEGEQASASGFLENYVQTTKAELETFVSETAKKYFPDAAPLGPVAAGPGEISPANNIYKIQARVEYGFPEAVIEDLSQRYDMVVMGTGRKSDLAVWVFGSVSVAVSQNAHCPVLLIPPNAEFAGFKNILYASNFESNDPEKVRQVVSFAKKFEAQVHFVHVGKVQEPGDKTEKALFEANYKYSDPDKPFIFQKIVGDDLTEKLHEYAFDHKIDLFVFVTPRRGFWKTLVHKSHTKEMVQYTTTPVLVVHEVNDLVPVD
jgi:nucleotide-binding universal stress UspA family protein